MSSEYHEGIFSQIIPVSDYQHRNGFSNQPIVDGLSQGDRAVIEEMLIQRLCTPVDNLIVETLAYLKSTRALGRMHEVLLESSDAMDRLIVAASIYEINADAEMIDLGIAAFKELQNEFAIIPAFYYLKRFSHPKSNAVISSYFEDKNYLISYNAKQALDHNQKNDVLKQKGLSPKRWWQFFR